MKIIKGNYGECRFCDNMDEIYGISSLQKAWDLCLTDPPYNVKCMTMHPKFSPKYQEAKIRYNDDLSDEKYKEWCFKWFEESKLKCNMYVFTPGYKNLKFWMKKYDFDMAVLYDISSQGGCNIASFRKWEPILTMNIPKYRNQHQRFKFAIFEEMNIVNQKNVLDYKHPCPKGINLWKRIIEELKPSSVLDIFLGSGTTAEICEMMGIPWLGYELKEDYAVDIKKRIQQGILKHKYYRKDKQTNLLMFRRSI